MVWHLSAGEKPDALNDRKSSYHHLRLKNVVLSNLNCRFGSEIEIETFGLFTTENIQSKEPLDTLCNTVIVNYMISFLNMFQALKRMMEKEIENEIEEGRTIVKKT